MEIYEAMRNRVSVRKYETDDVSPEKLNKILEAGCNAPSWKNMQCWRFVVVSEPAIKKELSLSLFSGNPAEKAVAGAPLVIVVCGDPESSGKQDGKEYYLLDAGIAMQQMMLAAYAEGLGTCWVAWFDEEKARAACAIPESYRVVAMTPVGIPARESRKPPRLNPGDVTFKEKWGEPFKLL